jgi:hypothetical protein
VVYWCVLLISIIICVTFAYFLVDQVVIISTSLIGSYFIIRGISLYAGGFPNENYVIDLIINKEFDTLHDVLGPIFYIYMVGWIILFIIGIVVQCKLKKEEQQKLEFNDNVRYFIHR